MACGGAGHMMRDREGTCEVEVYDFKKEVNINKGPVKLTRTLDKGDYIQKPPTLWNKFWLSISGNDYEQETWYDRSDFGDGDPYVYLKVCKKQYEPKEHTVCRDMVYFIFSVPYEIKYGKDGKRMIVRTGNSQLVSRLCRETAKLPGKFGRGTKKFLKEGASALTQSAIIPIFVLGGLADWFLKSDRDR